MKLLGSCSKAFVLTGISILGSSSRRRGENDVMKMRQVDDPHSVFSFGNNIDKLVVEIYLLR
jgi:hypothetical protein